MNGTVLPASFFQRDPLLCAQELIGCELVWNECAGIIVETEAYRAENDEACHTFMRRSARAFVEKHAPGTAYVYLNYGMYWLLNVLVKGNDGSGETGFVLIRALEPIRGAAEMQRRRAARRGTVAHSLRTLCSGPGKLTQALGIDGRDHGRDLCGQGGSVGFLPRVAPVEIVADVRIGISKAAHLPWRYLLAGSPFVSVALGRAGKLKPRQRTVT